LAGWIFWSRANNLLKVDRKSHPVHSGTLIKERGAQVVLNQWDVGSKMRDTLVDILKGLQVRQLHHHEKCLLEGVGDGGSFLQQ
jgi:hypothetical protein